jgi:hypothetical protein
MPLPNEEMARYQRSNVPNYLRASYGPRAPYNPRAPLPDPMETVRPPSPPATPNTTGARVSQSAGPYVYRSDFSYDPPNSTMGYYQQAQVPWDNLRRPYQAMSNYSGMTPAVGRYPEPQVDEALQRFLEQLAFWNQVNEQQRGTPPAQQGTPTPLPPRKVRR